MSKCPDFYEQMSEFDDFIFWQSDTKLCWGNEKMVGEMQQMDGEMKQNVLGRCPEGKVK